jgi:hypothetical protein
MSNTQGEIIGLGKGTSMNKIETATPNRTPLKRVQPSRTSSSFRRTVGVAEGSSAAWSGPSSPRA